MAELNMKIYTDVDDFARRVERAAEYVNAAPDDDPIKVALADFGEIDLDKHTKFKIEKRDREWFARLEVSAELDRMPDLVPAQ